jgi:glycosyltransferase involved in cell wall biosynthesis
LTDSMLIADSVCEIRVPTYRRPELLRRALQSVINQTYPHWRCLVFDDCRDGSAREIVEELNDQRVHYRRNDRRLGAIGNIDQCFRNRPFVGGSYACVVEDDNYLLPQHLEQQLHKCAEHHVDVIFAAQFCESVIVPGEPGELTETKTLAWIYPGGVHEPQDLLPAILFSHAFSNGGVFWRIGSYADFELGDITKNPGIQETARILRLKSRVYVCHEASAVWRTNDPRDSHVRKAGAKDARNRWQERWVQLTELREIMQLRSFYIKNYGIDDTLKFLARFGPTHQERIERSLLLCGKYVALTDRSLYWRIWQMIRGSAFRFLVPSRMDLSKAQGGALA